MHVGVRLLDMGVVRPVRSQSIYHAITAMMEPGSDPVIVLCRTNRPYVSTPQAADSAGRIDHNYCRINDLPVIPRQTGGAIEFVDNHQIRFHVIAPLSSWQSMGIPTTEEEWPTFLAQPIIRALDKLGLAGEYLAPNDIQINRQTITTLQMDPLEEAFILSISLPWESDARQLSEVMALGDESLKTKVRESLDTYTTDLGRELDKLPPVETIASAVVEAMETQWGLAVYPSFPTPEELEAIEDWDERLGEFAWNMGAAASPDALDIVDITANVKVMSATVGTDESQLRATVRTVEGELDSLVLTGDVRPHSETTLEKLAGKFSPAGVDSRLLLSKLITLANADDGTAPTPGNITAALKAAILQ